MYILQTCGSIELDIEDECGLTLWCNGKAAMWDASIPYGTSSSTASQVNQLFASGLGKQWKINQLFGSLQSTWEMLLNLLVSDFDLTQSWLLRPSE